MEETASQREIPCRKRTIIAATASALALNNQRRRSRVRLRHAMNSAVAKRPLKLPWSAGFTPYARLAIPRMWGDVGSDSRMSGKRNRSNCSIVKPAS